MSKLTNLIEGSKAFDVGYRDWRKYRRFIADELHGSGTFIDLGCANGFMICCLMKWSACDITPYGVDHDRESIAASRRLFPEFAEHFVWMDVGEFVQRRPRRFPGSYDYVLWNMPNTWPSERRAELIPRLLSLVSPAGKLLLAVYGVNRAGQSRAMFLEERKAIEQGFSELKDKGIQFTRIVPNPLGSNHYLGVIEGVGGGRPESY